jgi:hypothetical protein
MFFYEKSPVSHPDVIFHTSLYRIRMKNTEKDDIHHSQTIGNKKGVEVQVRVEFALWIKARVSDCRASRSVNLLPYAQSHLSLTHPEEKR